MVQRVLVLATSFVTLILVGTVGSYHLLHLPDPIKIDIRGQPTIGSSHAAVHVVAFEDFKCDNCKIFSDSIFPEIKRKYIDTGKIQYTFVPLAFMDGSKEAANAALCVYKLSPYRFFAYVERMYQDFLEGKKGWKTRDLLIEYAIQIGGINTRQLKMCIEKERYFPELDRNLKIAKHVMGKDFAIPALYVDGVPVSTDSLKVISKRIDHALAVKGKDAQF